MDKENNFIVCVFCKKTIVNKKVSIHYKPVYCVVDREMKKDKDGIFSNLEDDVYHYRCYKMKSWDEEDKSIKDLDKLGTVHC